MFGEYQRLICQFSERATTEEHTTGEKITDGRERKRGNKRGGERKRAWIAKKKKRTKILLDFPCVLRRVFDSRWRGINRNLLPLQAKPLMASSSSSFPSRPSSRFPPILPPLPSSSMLIFFFFFFSFFSHTPRPLQSSCRTLPCAHCSSRSLRGGNLLFQDCESPGVFAGLPTHGTINIEVPLLLVVRPSTKTTRRGNGDAYAAGRRGGAPCASSLPRKLTRRLFTASVARLQSP